MKPEYHVEHKTEALYRWNANDLKEAKRYMKVSISQEDIGNLLQGKHIILNFLNDGYELKGMLDICLSDDVTVFEVPERLNEFIIRK